jgi:GFO/IDH/MocA oxidoreductase family protein
LGRSRSRGHPWRPGHGERDYRDLYAKKRASENFKGVASDFRELREKEKDLDSVKIMTPDHLHATISIAAMKKRKHVLVHKPLANRLAEVRMVVEAAGKTRVATHLLAWHRPINPVRDMILDGAIGTLREVHNWTDRPYWSEALSLPSDTPPYHEPSTGTCGSAIALPAVSSQLYPCGFSRLVRIRTAASPIWGNTASGRSSWRSTCRSRTASKLKAASVAKSPTRSAPSI